MKYFDTFIKLPKNVGNLGKIIVAYGFEKLPKVQWITQSGYTAVPPPKLVFIFHVRSLRGVDGDDVDGGAIVLSLYSAPETSWLDLIEQKTFRSRKSFFNSDG